MTFKAHVFDEPMLEFGDGGQHCDPRQGLREYGPLQPRSGDVVRVGVIGTDDTVAGFTEFLGETANGIETDIPQVALGQDEIRQPTGPWQRSSVLRLRLMAPPQCDLRHATPAERLTVAIGPSFPAHPGSAAPWISCR